VARTAPIGYKRDRQGGLTADDESAEIARRIFAAKAAGATLTAIADDLNRVVADSSCYASAPTNRLFLITA